MNVNLPEVITAGVTFSHAVTFTAYPAPTWRVEMFLRGQQAIDLIAVPEGNQHRFGASAEITRMWAPGVYWYQVRATLGADAVLLADGEITVRPDLSQVDGFTDQRDHVVKVIDAIEAVIEGRATKDQEKYTINNRELWRTPIPDLLKLRDTYRNELRRQKNRKRTGQSLLGRNVMVRF